MIDHYKLKANSKEARVFLSIGPSNEVMDGKLRVMNARLLVGDPCKGDLLAGPEVRVMFDSDRPYGRKNWMMVKSSVQDVDLLAKSIKSSDTQELSARFKPFEPKSPTLMMEVGQSDSTEQFLGYLLDTSQAGRFDRMAVGFDPFEGHFYQQRVPCQQARDEQAEKDRFLNKAMIASRYCMTLQARLDRLMHDDKQTGAKNVADRLFEDVVYLYSESSEEGCNKPLGAFAQNEARSDFEDSEGNAYSPTKGVYNVYTGGLDFEWCFSESAAIDCFTPMVLAQGGGDFSIFCENDEASANVSFDIEPNDEQVKSKLSVWLMSLARQVEESITNAEIRTREMQEPDDSALPDVYADAEDLYRDSPN